MTHVLRTSDYLVIETSGASLTGAEAEEIKRRVAKGFGIDPNRVVLLNNATVKVVTVESGE